MKTRSFGKKCKCGHYKSEHDLQKHDFSEPKAIPEMGILFTHPPGMVKEPVHIHCRICDCKKLDSKKK